VLFVISNLLPYNFYVSTELSSKTTNYCLLITVYRACNIPIYRYELLFTENKLRITLMTRINVFLIRKIRVIRCLKFTRHSRVPLLKSPSELVRLSAEDIGVLTVY